jgi:D-alanyl-D-alanine carboxypeptidase
MSDSIAAIGLARIPPWVRVAGLAAASIAAASCWDQAQARSAHKHSAKHAIHGPDYHPPYADIVVDDKSGLVLHQVDADQPRHPASLTKIMTLYLLFERLDNGQLKLDTPLQVSTHAALAHPVKLGLKTSQTIAVEDAIKGLVTRSANDAAVVIAEAIGGSEDEFAKLMTLKARALGMTSTTYMNASGLPADEQITTAHDQALLGRAIQQRFPIYYRYFATPSFHYKGTDIRNHNNLLGAVRGVDGIKTGYTEASGYNLVSSVRRDERHIVAVVLGGTSGAARDARMRQLIEDNIAQASTQQSAPFIAELSGEDAAKAHAEALQAHAEALQAHAEAVKKANAVPLPRPRPAGEATPDSSKVAATGKGSHNRVQRRRQDRQTESGMIFLRIIIPLQLFV